MQLDYAIEGYWLAKRRDFSANTVNDYTLTFRRLIEFVGKTRDLQGISSDDINRFLNYLRDDLELSPKTILNHWIALSSFWTWVERDLRLPHIIRGRVNRPRPRRRLSAAYTEAEIRELLAACDKGRGVGSSTRSAFGRQTTVGAARWHPHAGAVGHRHPGFRADRAEDARV